MVEMIEYQDGAVVSRTFSKGKAGSFTLFAFDEGEELTEHTVPWDAFVEVLDGEVELEIDRVPVKAVSGDTVLMPGGKSHSVKAVSRFKMLLTLIRNQSD
jgi:quercetin dioxygenase-like cupin family protein